MEYTREFEVFWKLYPSRWSVNRHAYVKRKKYPAWLSWEKLDDDTRREILTKVKMIKSSEGNSPRDPVTWLNQRGWDDIDFEVGYVPSLPKELTDQALKDGKPHIINVNNERNRQKDGLGVR